MPFTLDEIREHYIAETSGTSDLSHPHDDVDLLDIVSQDFISIFDTKE